VGARSKQNLAVGARSKQDSAAAPVTGLKTTAARGRRRRPPPSEDRCGQRSKTLATGSRRSRQRRPRRSRRDQAAEKKLQEEEADGWWVDSATDQLGRVKLTLTLKIGSLYHVMNSTCIHLRVKGLNIYMYRRRRIYKEPLKKYNNRKG
jgi:hypothetical protein